MKRIFKILAISSAVMLMCTACEKAVTSKEDDKGKGTMSLKLSTEGDFVITDGQSNNSMTKAASVTKSAPNVSDFYVEVENTSGEYYKKWDSYSDVPSVVTLPADQYTLKAANGTLQPAQWEAPYYAGSTSFSVGIQELTNVSLTCRLANVKVTVHYSDEFLSMLTDVKTVVSNDSNGVLEYSANETRAGYFAVPSDGRLNVTVTARRSTGEAVQETVFLTGVAARQWHKVKIGVATSGTAGFELVIDDEMIEKEADITVPDGDDIIDNNGDEGVWDEEDPEEPGEGDEEDDPATPTAAAPSITGASFNGAAFDISRKVTISQTSADGTVLDVLIATDGSANPRPTIQNLFVTIAAPIIPNDLLTEMGLLGEFDMANLDTSSATYATLVNDLGLVDPNAPIKGKTSHTFSVGSFMTMLAGLGTGDSQFILRAVDSNGKSTSATLSVTITE